MAKPVEIWFSNMFMLCAVALSANSAVDADGLLRMLLDDIGCP
jgi:hypothetical protein